ncbi:conserved protein [Tepidicaulis marinus]|uniref:Conserved protein n=1 Tax=Tepidicaulis marinus TaxID=1333998 RepID=A0A081B667_9HYPH|nr:TrbC/VirB2 family protein [Tepidicaulis marinus]GAK43535.1 conserved protein [Tepidicaulis marinus]
MALKNLRDHLLAFSAASLIALCLSSLPAFAQDVGNGWEEPATGLIEVLQSGLVNIGVVLIGVGIIALGIYGVLTGQIDWKSFGMRLVGGLLIMVGPTMIVALLEVARQ